MTGDDRAFEELVRRRQGAIRGLLGRLTGHPALADDLAQETFFRAWQKLRTLKAPGAFGGWLRRIAVNAFLQQVRRRDISAPQAEDETESHPDSQPENPAVKMDLEQAMDRLRPEERLCVVLAYGEGLSHGEIAVATGLALGTVKSHISRGGARLRQLLADYKGGA